MFRITLPALALLSFGAGLPALAQEPPPYQPLETRHVCAAQPVYAAPDGAQARVLSAGETVRLRDVTFGPDGAAWFALDYATGKGLERAVGYLEIAAVTHFCPSSDAPPGEGQVQIPSVGGQSRLHLRPDGPQGQAHGPRRSHHLRR